MFIGFPATRSGVEIRILEQLFTPDEAEIALELSALPEAAATIWKRLKSRMALDELTQALETMSKKGVIMAFSAKGERRYGKMPFAIGMFERQLKTLTPELARDSRQYFEEEFGKAFYSGKTRQMRTVPVNRNIPVERNVSTHDDIRSFVERSEGPFAAMECICRHGEELQGKKCRQTQTRENCLTIGMGARFTMAHGVGREITREAMLELLDAADRDGLVLQPENTQNPMFVCCCCGCCCGVLNGARHLPNPAAVFNANFYAALDSALCQACGMCETRCQMEAISVSDGKHQVDRARCIGCALCATTCPSGALKMMANDRPHTPPDNTKALYMQILRERYGPWGMMKIAAQKTLGMKI